jgi:hypothetical protein
VKVIKPETTAPTSEEIKTKNLSSRRIKKSIEKNRESEMSKAYDLY